MKEFTRRIIWCKEHGHLTVADLARLFDRDARTVSDWVRKSRIPVGARVDDALKRLAYLELSIKLKRGFPVPIYLSKRNRTEYIRLLAGGHLERARIFASRATGSGLVRGARIPARARAG